MDDVDLLNKDEDVTQTRNLVVEFTRFRDKPLESLKTLLAHLQGSSWRAYDNYDGQKLYYPGLKDKVFDEAISRPVIAETVRKLIDKTMEREQKYGIPSQSRQGRRDQLESQLMSIAEDMLDKMMCLFQRKAILQMMYYSVAQMFSRTYHQGVHVDANELAMLKAKAKELEGKKQSMVFLPCHKSHIDYIALQFLCFRIGLSLPVVVAGDNLNFAVIGPMLRQVGAFYIRRSFGDDVLYQSVIQAYIETLLRNGYNFECFIEGTRSRTGKLLPPKFGILKYILEALMSGAVEDTWIVPVSTQYDKVVEAESYATELLGKDKVKESLSGFMDATSILTLRMGRVDVRFKEPWSLKEYVLNHLNAESMKPLVTSFPLKDPTWFTPQKQTHLLRALGYQVLSDINKASLVMPTSLIGAVLLTTSGRGISLDGLVVKVKWLIAKIRQAGGRVGTIPPGEAALTDKNLEVVVLNGLKVLGSDLVGKEEKGLIETIYYPKDPFKLSYYRNQVIHLFVSESIATVALYTQIKKANGLSHISRQAVLSEVRFLSALLSGEFVYGANGLELNFNKTLGHLEQQGIVHRGDKDDSLVVELSSTELGKGYEMFDFYCYLLWPFMDGFWLSSLALFMLVPTLEEAASVGNDQTASVWVEEKELLNAAQALGKTLYHQGQLTYYEAVNKELLKTSLNQYQGEGIVIRKLAKDKKVPVQISLKSSCRPDRAEQDSEMFRKDDLLPYGQLYEFSERISRARHKTLRHHDMSVTHKGADMNLLRLCSEMGQKLKTRQIMTVQEVRTDQGVVLSRPARSPQSIDAKL